MCVVRTAARTIYETVLPQAIKELDIRVSYHFGSPWSKKGTRDPTEGDSELFCLMHASLKAGSPLLGRVAR
jgi:hypothetical protein